ncbi:trimethylamine methyltransferase family protein [Thalassococcus sp. S3]|uniref:trimethylamine methyltransferase family protein n=1 Tax=Thalassococcus sp. S3 TaxID=2017482 RepID=UPI0010247AB4|nr:trimethylamine methyltransferase family protein [Thalassococcus sp. S3]QBF33024.1 trimethylamine methyltransferase [Thalassococcus sp. S3]
MNARAGGRRRRGAQTPPPRRDINYRQLRNPFPALKVWSEDEVAGIHDAALSVLEDLGLKVLLPEARALFQAGGARVDEASEMVWIGREIVEAAVASAPRSFPLHAGHPSRDLVMEPGALIFQPGAGAPHATDLRRGRRPGTEQDFRDLIRLTHHFDVLHMLPPLVEPQDVPMHLRHYALTEAQLTLSDKFPFVFSRGTPQVEQCFEMIRDFRGLSDAEFESSARCYTIINTNSPRQIDIPMAQGLIDFARAGQPSIVTPFTLMGAMAPITVGGAITLSHAEALAAITLTQLARPGAPVCYGTFTSNVDMKSGAPAFGTPEQMKANAAAGQLARYIDLPWRSAAGSAANLSDVQAAQETQFSLWGALMAGATVVIHAAGWLEGGLTVSFEKLVTDVEVLQMVAEMCAAPPADPALEALAEVQPGGHFFGAAHTMARYQTEFYDPLAADWSNFGTWTERGGLDATTRATAIWTRILEEGQPPAHDGDRIAALHDYIRRAGEAGGAAPVS